MSDFHNAPSALDVHTVTMLLNKLGSKWELNQAGHLQKIYHFTNFLEAMELANKIAMIAEKENHHPDLFISWGQCRVEIWTHDVNGLSQKDFGLATQIECLPH